jgi:hypothetical protein
MDLFIKTTRPHEKLPFLRAVLHSSLVTTLLLSPLGAINGGPALAWDDCRRTYTKAGDGVSVCRQGNLVRIKWKDGSGKSIVGACDADGSSDFEYVGMSKSTAKKWMRDNC